MPPLPLPLLLAALSLAAWIWGLLRRPPGFPPPEAPLANTRPTWFPLLGNYPGVCQLSKKLGSQYQTFTYLAQKYKSPVVGLRLGGDLTVIVSTRSLIREVLTRPEFEGRPQNFFAYLRSLGLRKVVDGKLWQEQRAFVMRHLRSLGFSGAQVGKEVRALLDVLNNSRGRPTQPISCWRPPCSTSSSNSVLKIIETHKATHTRGKKSDLIDALLSKMAKAKKEQNDNTTFTESQLLILCYDMFTAGAETTSNSLRFAFLMMLRHPDVQERVHKEIKEAVGTDRLPTHEDRDRLKNNINKTGKFRDDDAFLPFGLGRRRCLGEHLAKCCLFQMFTGILQKFQLLPVDGTSLKYSTLEGVTLAPKTCDIIFKSC
ncbi:methyl farnesoate epoxidase-like [Schistocerca americana]|uniref:methyl farnesoate epoxidase-like n=1 Tax=Schistocerca americana TaxID=7009 RepID=UPI001F4F938F|nr:methyl farnesoate epoxidase-like [Schistocerca americana]